MIDTGLSGSNLLMGLELVIQILRKLFFFAFFFLVSCSLVLLLCLLGFPGPLFMAYRFDGHDGNLTSNHPGGSNSKQKEGGHYGKRLGEAAESYLRRPLTTASGTPSNRTVMDDRLLFRIRKLEGSEKEVVEVIPTCCDVCPLGYGLGEREREHRQRGGRI